FDLHPIRTCAALLTARLDRTRQLDGSAEQEQLLRERGFPRVRMRNDGERTPALDRVDQGSHGKSGGVVAAGARENNLSRGVRGGSGFFARQSDQNFGLRAVNQDFASSVTRKARLVSVLFAWLQLEHEGSHADEFAEVVEAHFGWLALHRDFAHLAVGACARGGFG